MRTDLLPSTLSRVEHVYGLRPPTRLVPVPAGSVNSNYWLEHADGRCFLRIYEAQSATSVAGEWRLLLRLEQSGLPAVRRLLPPTSRDETVICTEHGKPVALFEAVPGADLCLRQVQREHLRLLGRSVCRVHEALSDASWIGPGRFRYGDLQRLQRTIAQHPNTTPAINQAVATALTGVPDVYAFGLPETVIHGDLFRDNALWHSDTEPPTIIDWESAHWGPRVLDLAVIILAWTYRDDFHWELGRALLEGYGAVTTAEREALFDVLRFACVRFLLTRVMDFHLEPGPDASRTYLRFEARLRALEALGPQGVLERLGQVARR